jgi:hypothetical protein
LKIHDLDDEDSRTRTYLGAGALNWILKRGIHLASLCIQLICYRTSKTDQQTIEAAFASLALDGRLDKLETIRPCNYIKDADLTSILSKCYSSVKSIDIKYCHFDDSSAVHIKRCSKLEVFTPTGNETCDEMVEIVQSCKKLRKVDLGGFDGDEDIDDVVMAVAAHCPLLEHIDCANCFYVTDAAINMVAESCPLLQFINAMGTNITDAAMASLCNRCPLLKCIGLNSCDELTDAAVLAVAERLPGITFIDLAGIAVSSSAVETLVRKCPDIQNIQLELCRNVSDVTLLKIAEHSSKLEYLNVSRCGKITEAGLAKVASKCSRLKSVYFDKIPETSADSLAALFPRVYWESY